MFVPVALTVTLPLLAVRPADFVDAFAVEAIVTFAVLTSMPASVDADTPMLLVFVTFATDVASIVIPPFLLSIEVKLPVRPIPALIVLWTVLETMEMPNAPPILSATVTATASAASDALSSATTSTSPVALTVTGPSMEAVTVLAIVL